MKPVCLCVCVSEEVWHMSSWWLRSGSGAFPHLAAKQTSHPRRLPLPTIHPALPTLNTLSHTHIHIYSDLACGSHKMCRYNIKSNNKEFYVWSL